MAPSKFEEATGVVDGTKDYKPLRTGKQYDLKKPHITETPMTWGNWWKHINWLNTTFILFIPFLGFLSTYWVPLKKETAIFAFLYYFNTGLGITAGKRSSLLCSASVRSTSC
jgi:stearoyl-CoA desaturase (Delta-9 desaturase)